MMPCNCYQESAPKAADMPPKIVETLFLIFNGCATSHVKRLRTDAAHLGLQPTLEITWACHSNFRSQKKYCVLTLTLTRGGRTPVVTTRLAPSARRRVQRVVRHIMMSVRTDES